ncbi:MULTISPECIES: TraB/GumN family protein [unclassified Sphingomonas]|uniref:TraB/GumN family protein n=1 Tax=unclassified Sphingomonas TaxID=196159 RepID=UPI002150B1D1|nr:MULTISPECIES: TraB/GumN family protein [unclassified Sphingomonas]MCR5870790.1 TraB/GumN family protein [Sphingomonas sp. J344]UUY00879.1 TraB/GumN family protein [Sphingomonas sp. J315]
MIKMLSRTGTALALLFVTPAALAQQAPAPAPVAQLKDSDPALWVVKDEDTTIYLFGTIHVLPAGLSWFDEAVKKAFDESSEMVTEIGEMPDPASVQPLILKYAVSTAGPTLTERLPADKRAAFAKAVADAGLPAQAVERFQPWFAASQLSLVALMKAGYNPASGAETALSEAAKAANKPVSGLESIEMQFGFFNSLSEAAQIQFLSETLEQLGQVGPEFAKMVAEWSEGDAEGLAAIMNEALRSSPELSKMLLADRNARWAEWIDTRLDKPGVVFMAVGAGHLSGPDSVQVMLEKRQIKTQRIEY